MLHPDEDEIPESLMDTILPCGDELERCAGEDTAFTPLLHELVAAVQQRGLGSPVIGTLPLCLIAPCFPCLWPVCSCLQLCSPFLASVSHLDLDRLAHSFPLLLCASNISHMSLHQISCGQPGWRGCPTCPACVSGLQLLIC